jgi:hypothetical protein
MVLRLLVWRTIVVDLALDVQASDRIVDAVLDVAEVAHGSPHCFPGRIDLGVSLASAWSPAERGICGSSTKIPRQLGET